jgi:uncharacterized repeat protein (TIGR02543 family)
MEKGKETALVKATFSRTGYTFEGWNTKPGGDGIAKGDGDKVTFETDTTLYAQWKAQTFTVYWLNEDGSELGKFENVPYEYKVKKDDYDGPAPTKASDNKYDYTFAGWDPEIPVGGYQITGETTFTAKFTAKEKEQSNPEGKTDGTKPTNPTDDKKPTDDTGNKSDTTSKRQPTAEEFKNAPVDNTLPVINPEKIKTAGSMKNQTMTIKLGKVNIDNCLVEYRQAGAKTWKSVWYGKGSQLVIKGMKKNGFYQYRFTTVKLVNGKWKKGKPSNICYRWIKNVKAKKPVAGKKKITVKWKKVKKVNGYEIQYARNKAFTKSAKKVTVKGAKKTKKTIKGLKKGKTYYVRIRPFKKKGGKKYLGIYTVAKKVKVK